MKDQSEEWGMEDAIVRELSVLPINVRTNRRPVIFDRLLTTALRLIRPGISNEAVGAIKRDIVRVFIRAIQGSYDQRLRELNQQIEELREEMARRAEQENFGAGLFTENELKTIRTYHQYGMSVADLATWLEISEARVRTALEGRETPADQLG